MVGAYQPTSGGPFYSLARVNGWGSAGSCPACQLAKTPAVRERVSRVAAVGDTGDNFARESVRAAAGGGVG